MTENIIKKCALAFANYSTYESLSNIFKNDSSVFLSFRVYKDDIEGGDNFLEYFENDTKKGLTELAEYIDKELIALLLNDKIDFILVEFGD